MTGGGNVPGMPTLPVNEFGVEGVRGTFVEKGFQVRSEFEGKFPSGKKSILLSLRVATSRKTTTCCLCQ